MSNQDKAGNARFAWKTWAVIGAVVVLAGVSAYIVTVFVMQQSGSFADPHMHHDHEHDHDHDHDEPTSNAESQFPPRKLRYAWHETDPNDQDAPRLPEGMPDDSIYVTLTGEYSQWLLGTPVEIAIPQIDKTYKSVVDRIVPDEFGNTSIYAKPEAGEKEFQQLIVTFGKAQTFAYVATTEGSFEFHGTDEAGWLTPTSSMGQHIDYSKPDVAETRRDRHANTKYVPRRED